MSLACCCFRFDVSLGITQTVGELLHSLLPVAGLFLRVYFLLVLCGEYFFISIPFAFCFVLFS